MFHRVHRSTFLRPRERLNELMVLFHVSTNRGAPESAQVDSFLGRRTLAGFIGALVERGLLDRRIGAEGEHLALTNAGRRRLRYLLVDYARELHQLVEGSHDLYRSSLAKLALDGVRRVAFYPASETAEVAAPLLGAMDLDLVAVVDDSPSRWGLPFVLGLRVERPEILRDLQLDAIIIATAMFEDAILEAVTRLQLPGVRVHLL